MRVPVVLSALVVAAVGVAAVGALSAQQNPFVGRWNITGTGPDARGVSFLEVKQVGDHLEGMFLNRGGHATPVAWIKVVDGELQWQYGGNAETLPKPSCGPLYRAKLEGGKLIGSHETPGVPCPHAPASGGSRSANRDRASAPAGAADRPLGRRPPARVPALQRQRHARLRHARRHRRTRRGQGSLGRARQRPGADVRRPLDDRRTA